MSEAEIPGIARESPARRGGTTSAKSARKVRSAVDNQRSEFLRACRARLTPADVGLPMSRLTRGGGLRREDVAAISGVSASWYTWLEQGRDMRVSDEVLERLSETLKLSEDERIYLFSLVQGRPPRLRNVARMEAPPDITRMIDSLTVPAIVMNLRWDVLAWNRINSLIYRDYGTRAPNDRNLLEILLTRPVHHLSREQLEIAAARMVARLRFDYSRCADDPRFESLVRRLNTVSPLFARLWRRPEFSLRAHGVHRFRHPQYGELAFEHTSCVPDGHPGVRVLIGAPANAAAGRALVLANEAVAKAQK
jgi:transcriptional regulator with XRE-family HTH domain